MKRVLLAALLYAALTVPAHALVDISSKVQVIKGPPTFNYVTNQTSVSLSVKNISAENLQTPVRVTLDSISPIAVVCANPDGIDSSGKPFFLLMVVNATEIKPGETSGTKQILFNNPKKYRFSFLTRAYISVPENTIENFVSALQLVDVETASHQFDDKVKSKYKLYLTNNTDKFTDLIQEIPNGTIRYITNYLAEFEFTVMEEGEETVYSIMLYRNENGEWKIYSL
jgi:hypothetical protein